MQGALRVLAVAAIALSGLVVGPAASTTLAGDGVSASAAAFAPAVAEWQFLSAGTTPPSEAACYAAGRRCFTPAAMAGS